MTPDRSSAHTDVTRSTPNGVPLVSTMPAPSSLWLEGRAEIDYDLLGRLVLSAPGVR